MQLKPVARVITVLLVSIGLLITAFIAIPSLPALGHELSRLTKASLTDKVGSSPHSDFVQLGITDTTSTTPTTELTSTVNITPTTTLTKPTLTPTPTEETTSSASPTPEPTDSVVPTVPSSPPGKEKSGVLSDLIGLLYARPLIPMGFIFVILVFALTLILITSLRKGKRKPPPQKVGGSTAPLLPKVTPARERALQLKDDPDITFPLAIDDIRIGRSPDNTIVITPDMPGAETVSRYHARLYRLEQWILEDLGSTNGIYVNGLRTGRNYLRNGWDIGIGGVIFTFHTGNVET